MGQDSSSAQVLQQVRADLHQPIFAAAAAAAADILDHCGDSVSAILFYGSCLRLGTDDEKILDFYVLSDDLAHANDSRFLGFLNRLLPPNVYYREADFDGRKVRSKYAVMSLAGFEAAMQPGHFNPTFWARFAQPAALAYTRDAAAEAQVEAALAQAIGTAAVKAAPMCASLFTADDLWSRAFELTYRAELRAEKASEKGREIFLEYPDRYRLLTVPALEAAGLSVSEVRDGALTVSLGRRQRRLSGLVWQLRIVHGKLLSLLRLMKATLTFSGGLDYLAWKIRRHSGVDIPISPWQRRHPLIGGIVLYFQHRRGGGFR